MQCAWQSEWEPLIEVLRREVKPALGCTEPIAVALAAAHCRRLLRSVPSRLQVWVSGNLFKNGMGVGVPGTGMNGLSIAAAVGAVAGDADAGLEVLRAIDAADVALARDLLPATSIDVKLVAEVLYVEVLAEADGHQARVIICTDHTRVVLMERDGEVLHSQSREPAAQVQKQAGMSLQTILQFASQVPLASIAFIREAASLNQALADEGLRGYGLRIGQMLTSQIEKRVLSDDLMTLAMRLSSAATDAFAASGAGCQCSPDCLFVDAVGSFPNLTFGTPPFPGGASSRAACPGSVLCRVLVWSTR